MNHDEMLRPSEYTAALISILRDNKTLVEGKAVLEIGVGSGVVLGALGQLEAAALAGVDVEELAVNTSQRLLDSLGFGAKSELHLGNVWSAVPDREFDLIVANLPALPTEQTTPADRLRSWSSGGPDGRVVIEPFLRGLRSHLRPHGYVFMTHPGFADLSRTEEIAKQEGLSLTVASKSMYCVPSEKLARITPSVRMAHLGKSIHLIGPWAFAETYVLRLRIAERCDE